MRTVPLLAAAACLLTLAAPVATADATLPTWCYGYPVGWGGYYEHCVDPNDPECLYSIRFWSGADEFYTCTGV